MRCQALMIQEKFAESRQVAREGMRKARQAYDAAKEEEEKARQAAEAAELAGASKKAKQKRGLESYEKKLEQTNMNWERIFTDWEANSASKLSQKK